MEAMRPVLYQMRVFMYMLTKFFTHNFKEYVAEYIEKIDEYRLFAISKDGGHFYLGKYSEGRLEPNDRAGNYGWDVGRFATKLYEKFLASVQVGEIMIRSYDMEKIIKRTGRPPQTAKIIRTHYLRSLGWTYKKIALEVLGKENKKTMNRWLYDYRVVGDRIIRVIHRKIARRSKTS